MGAIFDDVINNLPPKNLSVGHLVFRNTVQEISAPKKYFLADDCRRSVDGVVQLIGSEDFQFWAALDD